MIKYKSNSKRYKVRVPPKTLREDIKPQMVNITNKPFEAGLIADRHNMPVNQYIYDNIFSQELMFDYNTQYEIVLKFLKEYIGFDENGIPNRDLIVYLTGLQAALATLIKVCFDYKVNLTLKLYNQNTRVYHDLVMFKDFDNRATTSPFYNLLEHHKYIYTYGIKESEIKPGGTLYLIKKTIYYKDQDSVSIAYVAPNVRTAMVYYDKIIKSIDHKTQLTDIGVYPCIFDKYGYLIMVNIPTALYRDTRNLGGD